MPQEIWTIVAHFYVVGPIIEIIKKTVFPFTLTKVPSFLDVVHAIRNPLSRILADIFFALGIVQYKLTDNEN